MKRGKGANQYGRYVWIPTDQQKADAKYSARITRKGLTIRANSDSIDELEKDLKEALERLTPLADTGEVADKEREDGVE